jgi:hypothetical protein
MTADVQAGRRQIRDLSHAPDSRRSRSIGASCPKSPVFTLA